jgi:hypothetical protein
MSQYIVEFVIVILFIPVVISYYMWMNTGLLSNMWGLAFYSHVERTFVTALFSLDGRYQHIQFV